MNLELLDRYIAIKTPHAKKRLGVRLLVEARDEIRRLEAELAKLTRRREPATRPAPYHLSDGNLP